MSSTIWWSSWATTIRRWSRAPAPAIFLHVAAPGYAPTQGCIALARAHLQGLVARAGLGDALAIRLDHRGV